MPNRFRDGSHGFKRRVYVLPFRARFDGAARDNKLFSKLLAEKDGIFAWLVEGARAYCEHGLGETPQVVLDETDAYISANDPLAKFAKLHADPSQKAPARQLYEVYCNWCHANGEQPREEVYFKGDLLERDVYQKRKGMVYIRQNDGSTGNIFRLKLLFLEPY